jgi:hypothetical protein
MLIAPCRCAAAHIVVSLAVVWLLVIYLNLAFAVIPALGWTVFFAQHLGMLSACLLNFLQVL